MNPSVGGLYVCMIYVCVAYNVCVCVRLSLMCTDIYVCMYVYEGWLSVRISKWLYVCKCMCRHVAVCVCMCMYLDECPRLFT